MKVFMLWNYYPTYLRYFYQKYPEALNLPFEEHRQRIFDDHFGWPADLGQHMNRNGIRTQFIISNAETVQKAWAKENGFYSWSENTWEHNIVLEQLRRFKPDILITPNPSDDFLKEARNSFGKLFLYLGHKIPHLRILDEADHIIAPYAKRVLPYYPQREKILEVRSGFCPSVLEKLGTEKKEYDIVFVGNITPEHQRRAEILAYLIRNGIDIRLFGEKPGLGRKAALNRGINIISEGRVFRGMEFLAKNLLTSDYRKNVETIRTVLQPAVFGMEYYRTISKAWLGLNIHIDLAEGKPSGNMRTFETTGVGTCLITDSMVQTNINLFKPEKEVLTFESKEDLLALLRKIKSNKKKIEDVAHAGQKRTLKEHSVKQMFDQIQAIIL